MTAQDYMIGNDALTSIVHRVKPKYGIRRHQRRKPITINRDKNPVQLPEKKEKATRHSLSLSGTPHHSTMLIV